MCATVSWAGAQSLSCCTPTPKPGEPGTACGKMSMGSEDEGGGGAVGVCPGLTQAHVEHILHGLAWLRVEDATTHAQPDDGHLGNHAAQQDAQVASAVVHQVQGAGLVGVVDQAKEHHGQDHKPWGSWGEK